MKKFASSLAIGMGGCLLVLVFAGLGALVGGWLLMLLIGALWHEFGWLEPIGYWPSVGIAFLLSACFTIITGGAKATFSRE